jgi:hypothetical protein
MQTGALTASFAKADGWVVKLIQAAVTKSQPKKFKTTDAMRNFGLLVSTQINGN